jgi:hypothetical protein
MNDNMYNMLPIQQLSQMSDNDIVAALIRNLAISGQLNSIDNGASGYSYGGRIGSALPAGEGLFRAGITGQGYSAKTPYGNFKNNELTGGDIGYSWNDNDLSLSYDRQGGTGGVPLWQLLFKKYF